MMPKGIVIGPRHKGAREITGIQMRHDCETYRLLLHAGGTGDRERGEHGERGDPGACGTKRLELLESATKIGERRAPIVMACSQSLMGKDAGSTRTVQWRRSR